MIRWLRDIVRVLVVGMIVDAMFVAVRIGVVGSVMVVGEEGST